MIRPMAPSPLDRCPTHLYNHLDHGRLSTGSILGFGGSFALCHDPQGRDPASEGLF